MRLVRLLRAAAEGILMQEYRKFRNQEGKASAAVTLIAATLLGAAVGTQYPRIRDYLQHQRTAYVRETAREIGMPMPPSLVKFSLPDGMKVAKAYTVKTGDKNYTFVAGLKCNDEHGIGSPDGDRCHFGGYAFILANDNSGILQLEEKEVGGFYWDNLKFRLIGDKIHVFAQSTEFGASSSWENLDVYAVGKDGVDKVLSVNGNQLLLKEVSGRLPEEIIEISRVAYSGQENLPRSNIRYYPEVSVYAWNGARYEKDSVVSGRINHTKQSVAAIVNQSQYSNRNNVERELKAYLNNFDEDLQKLIMMLAAQEAGRYDLSREIESNANTLPISDLRVFFLQRFAYHLDQEWKRQQAARNARYGISQQPQQMNDNTYEVIIDGQRYSGPREQVEELYRQKLREKEEQHRQRIINSAEQYKQEQFKREQENFGFSPGQAAEDAVKGFEQFMQNLFPPPQK